jgi:hypothetical protein
MRRWWSTAGPLPASPGRSATAPRHGRRQGAAGRGGAGPCRPPGVGGGRRALVGGERAHGPELAQGARRRQEEQPRNPEAGPRRGGGSGFGAAGRNPLAGAGRASQASQRCAERAGEGATLRRWGAAMPMRTALPWMATTRTVTSSSPRRSRLAGSSPLLPAVYHGEQEPVSHWPRVHRPPPSPTVTWPLLTVIYSREERNSVMNRARRNAPARRLRRGHRASPQPGHRHPIWPSISDGRLWGPLFFSFSSRPL